MICWPKPLDILAQCCFAVVVSVSGRQSWAKALRTDTLTLIVLMHAWWWCEIGNGNGNGCPTNFETRNMYC